ncbi:hypothetical protein DSO57_1013857 [Entomophthora muscae]|uniref:Uncharacterized protein n=1 Tax=Entomophthora muscae TaxID=34485 RepID=A0ACC2U501_9FUNG|nr:hypothetical protein DSO57_1013857 [Entomophthora muscae]
MSQETSVLELFAVGVGLSSVGLNLAVIFIAVHQMRHNSSLGLKMVLIIAAFDLLAPITGMVQELLSIRINSNIMAFHLNCQILGAVHSIIPFMSTTSVAIVALERCLHIHERSLRPRTYLFIALGFLATCSTLASLTAYNSGFKLTPSRIACNMSTRNGFFGKLYFYVFMLTLIINCFIIVYCYCDIIKFGFRPVSKTQDDLLNMHLEQVDSPTQVRLKFPSSSTINFSSRLNYPKTFALRAILIMVTYLTIIAPCIGIMIYEAYTGRHLSYIQSSLFVMLLFSFTLINPILLILLHTSISRAFAYPFYACLKKLHN